jgi:cation diffusion facilitator family transporter
VTRSSTLVEQAGAAPSHRDRLARNERRTTVVMALSALMMIAELVAGSLTGSLALVADGWHMASHVGALGLSLFAYWYARRHEGSDAFAFGTGKIHALAGYTSAAALAVGAAVVLGESFARLAAPGRIAAEGALGVALIGLVFNLVCAYLLDERGEEAHAHCAHGHDHNLRAVYLHVLADALTSLVAIAALVAYRWLGWSWADPFAAGVGALVVLRWAWGLCRVSARQLLDATAVPEIATQLRLALETTGATIAALRFWDLGPGQRGLLVSLRATHPLPLADYRARVAAVVPLSLVMIEVEAGPPGERAPR